MPLSLGDSFTTATNWASQPIRQMLCEAAIERGGAGPDTLGASAVGDNAAWDQQVAYLRFTFSTAGLWVKSLPADGDPLDAGNENVPGSVAYYIDATYDPDTGGTQPEADIVPRSRYLWEELFGTGRRNWLNKVPLEFDSRTAFEFYTSYWSEHFDGAGDVYVNEWHVGDRARDLADGVVKVRTAGSPDTWEPTGLTVPDVVEFETRSGRSDRGLFGFDIDYGPGSRYHWIAGLYLFEEIRAVFYAMRKRVSLPGAAYNSGTRTFDFATVTNNGSTLTMDARADFVQLQDVPGQLATVEFWMAGDDGLWHQVGTATSSTAWSATFTRPTVVSAASVWFLIVVHHDIPGGFTWQ